MLEFEEKQVKLGFSGTRKRWTTEQGDAVEKELTRISELDGLYGLEEFHHGDCVGSDEAAHYEVYYEYPACNIVIHPPTNGKLAAGCEADVRREPQSYLARNMSIVAQTDYLLATPAGPEKLRSGTWSTIRKALKAKMPTSVIYPDGTIARFHGETK